VEGGGELGREGGKNLLMKRNEEGGDSDKIGGKACLSPKPGSGASYDRVCRGKGRSYNFLVSAHRKRGKCRAYISGGRVSLVLKKGAKSDT